MLSKLRSSSVLTDNLTVAQYDASAKGYAIEPFAGFMYPMYTMVNTKASRPYTGMLFIEDLMSQDGFKPWGKSIGAYSPDPAIAVNEGDLAIDVWKSTLVMEDAAYILDSFEVEDFILDGPYGGHRYGIVGLHRGLDVFLDLLFKCHSSTNVAIIRQKWSAGRKNRFFLLYL